MSNAIGVTDQAGLCLSCGAPFVARLDASDTIALDRAYLSLLWMNSKARSSSKMIRMFEHPRLANTVERAHVFHQSHHKPALEFMIRTAKGDRDRREPGQRQPLNASPGYEPLPYDAVPTSKTNRQPMMAFWDRPAERERLDMTDLTQLIIRDIITPSPDPAAFGLNFDVETFGRTCLTCVDCNAVMTRGKRFLDLLLREAGPLVSDPQAIQVRTVTVRGHPRPEDGVAFWHQSGTDQRDNTSLTPLVAYYLHMCLPWPVAGIEDDFLKTALDAIDPGLTADTPLSTHFKARALFLQQCWLVLQIACLCGAVQRSTQPHEGRLSCGYKAYMGSLDLYASFFCWRLFEFEHGGNYSASLDFEQWHQKYFTCATRCKGLRLPRRRTIGEWLDPGEVAPRALVQRIQQRLVELYRVRLRPLRDFLTGQVGVPDDVSLFFVHPRRLRLLKDLSRRNSHADFDGALACFGVRALTYRMLDLCRLYPSDILDMLHDFIKHWTWREIGNVQTHHAWIDARSASVWYDLARLVVRPDSLPMDRLELGKAKKGPKCSPWASVPTLRKMGAFTERRSHRQAWSGSAPAGA